MFSGANEEKLSNAFPRNPLPSPTTPRKALKTDAFSTPSKLGNGNPADSSIVKLKPSSPIGTIEGLQQHSLTPGLFSNDNLLFLDETHTPRRFRDITDQESELAMQPLQIFEREEISISTKVKDRVRAIANKHDMQTSALF